MSIELNNDQLNAVSECLKWWKDEYKDRPWFEITGPAGSGKSTVAYYVINELDIPEANVLYTAFTGQAAMELTRKGCKAKTIHSVFYKLVHEKKLDDSGSPIVNDMGKTKYRKVFKKKDSLEYDVDVIVIDEGSMVSETIARDVLSFNIPIIVLGDINQLEPVGGTSFFFKTPDVILREILRQKKGDPIIYLSQMVLNDQRINLGRYGDKCKVIKKGDILDNMLMEPDVILCGKNITRNGLNNHIRQNILNLDNNMTIGDKVICRKNNWSLYLDSGLYLINGLNGIVEDIYYESFVKSSNSVCIDFRPEFLDHEYFEYVNIDLEHLYGIKDKKNFSNYATANIFEWGYALTCHLAQGSQYDNVLIFNEHLGTRDTYKRWLYTAITRAKTNLTLAI